MWIDTHVHLLLLKQKELDVSQLLEQCRQDDFDYLLDIGTCWEDLEPRLSFVSEKVQKPFLFSAAGIHPDHLSQTWKDDIDHVEHYLQKYSYVAVGEIGLDILSDVPMERQKNGLATQIQLANQYHLPVVIHNRQCSPLLLDILKANHLQQASIMHCFSDQWEYAKKFVDLGFFISFSGNLTFKKSEYLYESLKNIPIEQILVETDSPFLSPVPFRGKINTPMRIPVIVQFMANILEMDHLILAEQLKKNFETFLKIST